MMPQSKKRKPAKARHRSKPLDKAQMKALIAKRWDLNQARYANRAEAEADGMSYKVIAQALGVSPQRICNQVKGRDPVSEPLRDYLAPKLDLPELAPPALPRPPRSYADLKVQLRDHQRKIQKRIEAGEIERVPAVVLEERALINKWKKLVKRHGSKAAAIRYLIEHG